MSTETANWTDRHYATLSEGLEKGWVVVKETGNVNELSVENISSTATVFLNAGDIVKGGRQDRTVRDDLILPPKSGKVPLAAFCVEHGRWTKRGAEDPSAFSGNSQVLVSRKLRMAARYENNQSAVWEDVKDVQSKLNSNVSRLAGKEVDTRNQDSASSLQLTLENKELVAVKREYWDKINPALDGKTDVIGFIYAINGEINSAEVYNNKTLFRALWPKLLDAAVTEAIAESRVERQTTRVEANDVRAFFERAVAGTKTDGRTPWKSTRVATVTTDATILFETFDQSANGAWIHKSFIQKESQKTAVPLGSDN